MESEGISFTAFMTEAPEHATELTRRALQDGCDLVVSVGGDGTHNEVMNGFFTAEGPVRPKRSSLSSPWARAATLSKHCTFPRIPRQR